MSLRVNVFPSPVLSAGKYRVSIFYRHNGSSPVCSKLQGMHRKCTWPPAIFAHCHCTKCNYSTQYIYIYIRYLYARNIRNISSTSLIKMNSLIKFVGNIDLSNFNFLKDNDVYFYSE